MRSVRNIVRTLLVILFIYIVPTGIWGQGVYSNQTLQRIAEMLPEIPAETTSCDEIILSRVHKECPIIVNRNAEGTIIHIGFKIFNRKVTEKHPTPLYDFIERYILELYLLSSDLEMATRLKMDRVRISSESHSLSSSLKKGLQRILSENTDDCSLYITCNNNRYTVSMIHKDRQLLQIGFPIRHELITGYSKLEAESLFYPSLLMHTDIQSSPLTDMEMIPYKDSLYHTFEESYIMNKVISTSYYYKETEGYLPVISPIYPLESVYNLFNAQNHKENITVAISQSLYGGKRLDYEVPLNQLTDFLHKQNCTIYTGIKEVNDSIISATGMAVNMELGYQHLVTFTVGRQLLDHPEKYAIKAKMYCYIPIHNISTLFGN